jgi:hypothetical protein
MPGNDPAEPQQLCGDAPDSEAYLVMIFGHRFFQLCICQELLEPGVLVLELCQYRRNFGSRASALLYAAVVCALRYQDQSADVDDRLALGNQLPDSFGFAYVLLRLVSGAFHGGVPGPFRPSGNSHSL